LLAGTATASNATLNTTLNRWSVTIGADARAVSTAAQQRHPRRMVAAALRFRQDALHARTAVGAQRPSNTRGFRAKRYALAAYADYAAAGSRWAASGRARLAHRTVAAAASARAGAALAQAGNRLLIAAGKLLP